MDIDDVMDWISDHFSIILGIAGILFVIFILCGFTFSIGESTGEHTGYVTAVETNNGLIYTDRIVYFKTDSQSSQEDMYCVNDMDVKQQLEEYARTNERVTIKYHNDYILWYSECARGSTIITDVSTD